MDKGALNDTICVFMITDVSALAKLCMCVSVRACVCACVCPHLSSCGALVADSSHFQLIGPFIKASNPPMICPLVTASL